MPRDAAKWDENIMLSVTLLSYLCKLVIAVYIIIVIVIIITSTRR